ncbi:MAG TPA: hydroxyacid-oxoacid transhydrogenase [Sulfolobales archaeon]|nr:hydroxyacid-oxoacid transhydrogenase [Sulfolobales archaeon]
MSIEYSYLSYSPHIDPVFTISLPQTIKFGMGVSREAGYEAKRLGIKKALMVVGPRLSGSRLAEEVRSSLEAEGIHVEVLTKVKIEPEDEEIAEAYKEIKGKEIDGFIALGGGSTIDTAKILDLLHTYPAPLEDYINRPIGRGLQPPGPLKPLIAIPTTAGTGSESTSVAILDIKRLRVKSGISNPYMRPTVALIDPLTTVTMPPMVTASSGLDVLNHAIESFTARPYTSKPAIKSPAERPVYSGATPLGDLFGQQAIIWVNRYLRRAYADPNDLEARYYMMLAASIAGIGFGHVGVHIPHAMAYPIAGMVRSYYPPDYEFGYPIAPHGIATAIPAGYVFKHIASYNLPKFSKTVELLTGERVQNAKEVEERLFEYYVKLLEDFGIPTNLRELGFGKEDLEALVEGTLKQQRLLNQSPKQVSKKDLEKIFSDALD